MKQSRTGFLGLTRSCAVRCFSSSGEESGEESESDGEGGNESLDVIDPSSSGTAVASISIPDGLPMVPVLALTRNPIFPRFVKMLEVCVLCVDPKGMCERHTHTHTHLHSYNGCTHVHNTHTCVCIPQVNDKSLISLLRRKVRLSQPYAGAFLKKSDE